MLGKGGFAKCYEVTNMDNKRQLAAKIIAKSSLKRKRAKQKVTSQLDRMGLRRDLLFLAAF